MMSIRFCKALGVSLVGGAAIVAALNVTSSLACSASDQSLAGHYYLSGINEVGSELLLHPDGKFQYALAYGGVDDAAIGCWKRTGDKVVLSGMEASSLASRLQLKIAGPNELDATFRNPRGDDHGVYARSVNRSTSETN
jgi:hypothetical protein